MAYVPYGVETLLKISIVWVGRTNVTDDRQTNRQTDDRRQTDGRTMTYSEHELEFTFAKNRWPFFAQHCCQSGNLIHFTWCHPLESVTPTFFLPLRPPFSTVLCKFSPPKFFSSGCHLRRSALPHLLVSNCTFLLGVMAEALRANIGSKSAISL